MSNPDRLIRLAPPPYAVIAAATGMSRADWEKRKQVVAELMAYDPAEAGVFGVLLRKVMTLVAGQAELAAILGASVPTLHRWAADPRKADAALSPIQRAATASMLCAVLFHGVDAVSRTLPTLLAHIKADIAVSFSAELEGKTLRKAKTASPARTPNRSRAAKTAVRARKKAPRSRALAAERVKSHRVTR